MTLLDVISYSWILAVTVSVVIAGSRDQPVLEAFLPIKSYSGFCCQMVLVAWVCILAVLQLFDCPPILGQQPMTWAALMILVYAWICLAYFYRGRE